MSEELDKLYRIGVLAPWYLREDQFDIYRLLLTQRYPFVECARRFGKTTSILVYVWEQLRANPGWVCRWCEPFKNQAREIVMPEMDKIQLHCPDEVRFKWNTTDSYYMGPEGSRLYLRGVNDDRGESARGPFANIIVADEYGSWKNAEYVRKDILNPQLLTTRGQFIYASTPPPDLGHSYYDHKIEALKLNRFIQRTVYENTSLTEEDIEDAKREAGGSESSTWRREYLCEPVADTQALVIPEFREEQHVHADIKHPDYYDSYVGADLGFNDNTFLVFGYYDFPEATLVVENELSVNGMNSAEISTAAKNIEVQLWGEKPVHLRIGDNDLQQLYDFTTIHGYDITPTRKDDKQAAVNELRLRFQAGKIKIHKRCVNLIFQLKVGMWDARRKGFERGDKTGHLDGIDALVYLNRNLDLNRNPWPKLYGLSQQTHFISKQIEEAEYSDNDALIEAFKIKRGN